MEQYIGIIPAHYESSRFPGKPLCDILGKTMIQRVYESVIKWNKWKKVYITTDNAEIYNKCTNINIPCLMTGICHRDCLDRAAEVVDILEKKQEGSEKYIVIQGDEPLFNIQTLNVDLSPSIITFYTEAIDPVDKYDTNAVKVVISKNNKAIYFSRYSLPYDDKKTKRTFDNVVIYKQICAYVFSGEMLRLYTSLKTTPLENMEGIGLNRLIENDIEIYMRYTKYNSIRVATPEDRDRVVVLIKEKYAEKNMSIGDNGEISNCDGYRNP